MDIKLARIHNKNMLMRIAQQAPAAAPAAAPADAGRSIGFGSQNMGRGPDRGKPVTQDEAIYAQDVAQHSRPGGVSIPATVPAAAPAAAPAAPAAPAATTPAAAPKALEVAYNNFITRQRLEAFQQQPWLINLFYAYQPQPSTKLENELAGAVRRATGTSSDRIREHLANALSRMEAPKVSSLRDKAVNEYGRWNEQVTSELARTQGQAESQKSQDANKAYDALLQWEEGTDDPSWLFLTNEVSKAALKQAQMKIVREIEREGSGILNSSPLSFTEVATDPVSYFSALMEQGYVRLIQSKGIPLPFDVIMGWAGALNEAQRMVPQFQRFQGLVDQAAERQGFQTDMRGIRNQGMLDRARAAEQRRMQRRRTR